MTPLVTKNEDGTITITDKDNMIQTWNGTEVISYPNQVYKGELKDLQGLLDINTAMLSSVTNELNQIQTKVNDLILIVQAANSVL